MSKTSVRKRIRRLKREHREEINEATAYLVEKLHHRELEVAELRADVTVVDADRHRLRRELVQCAMRLAMAHGYLAAYAAVARGEPLAAVPIIEIKDIIPAV